MRQVKRTPIQPLPINPEDVDIARYAVFYKTANGTCSKLQKVGPCVYAFLYINRPELEPVFIRSFAAESIEAACGKQEVMTGTNEEMFRYFYPNAK